MSLRRRIQWTAVAATCGLLLTAAVFAQNTAQKRETKQQPSRESKQLNRETRQQPNAVTTRKVPAPGQASDQGDLSQRCNAVARRHALSGEDLAAFTRRCNAGQVQLPAAASGPPTCEERARVRDLSGDALSAYVRRCQAGQT